MKNDPEIIHVNWNNQDYIISNCDILTEIEDSYTRSRYFTAEEDFIEQLVGKSIKDVTNY